MKADVISSVFWLAIGLISLYGAHLLGLGTWHEPGSGFLPFLAGCFISIMALAVLLQALIRKRKSQADVTAPWKNVNWRRPLFICVMLAVYLLVFEKLGFLLTNVLLLFFLFKKVENLSWGKALVYPVLTVGFSYLLFNVFLKATLPKGFLGF